MKNWLKPLWNFWRKSEAQHVAERVNRSWAEAQRVDSGIGAQTVQDLLSAVAPTAPPPGMSQEQFADNFAQVRKDENRLHTCRLRIIAMNNSAVDRDLGRRPDGTKIYGDSYLPLRDELYQALREDAVTAEEYAKLHVTVREPRRA